MSEPTEHVSKLNQDGSLSKSIVSSKYKDKYGKTKHNGDEISVALANYTRDKRGFDVDKLVEVANANGKEMIEALKGWSHLNNGQVRMLLGAALRARKRYGIDVVIGDTVIKGDPIPEGQTDYTPRKNRKGPRPVKPKKSLREALGLTPKRDDEDLLEDGEEEIDPDEDEEDEGLQTRR